MGKFIGMATHVIEASRARQYLAPLLRKDANAGDCLAMKDY